MVNRKDLTTASVALHWGHDYFDCGYACSSERFSRGSSWPRDWTRIPCIAGKFFSIEPPGKPAHASKVMHKILHARLQHYVNQELSDVQVGFRKGRRIRDQIANTYWIIEKGRKFQKIVYFCFIDYAKAFDCVDHNKLWKALKEMGISDHFNCLLRNLHVGQEAAVRTLYGATDWFKIEKTV